MPCRFFASGAVLAFAAAALCACAALPSSPGVAQTRAERGQDLAARQCALCHDVVGSGQSPRPGAPSFAVLRLRFNAISWERALERIAAGEHYEMPAFHLDPQDVADLRAYVETVR